MEPTSCSSSFIDSFYFMSTEIRSHPFLCAVFWGQAALSVGWRPLFCPEKRLHTSLEGQTRMILWVDPREKQFARNEQVRLAFDACMYQIGWVVVSNSTIFNYIYIYIYFFFPIPFGERLPILQDRFETTSEFCCKSPPCFLFLGDHGALFFPQVGPFTQRHSVISYWMFRTTEPGWKRDGWWTSPRRNLDSFLFVLCLQQEPWRRDEDVRTHGVRNGVWFIDVFCFSCLPLHIFMIEGSLVEKLSSYGDLNMRRVQ